MLDDSDAQLGIQIFMNQTSSMHPFSPECQIVLTPIVLSLLNRCLLLNSHVLTMNSRTRQRPYVLNVNVKRTNSNDLVYVSFGNTFAGDAGTR